MGKKFSELERAVGLNTGDLAAFAQVDQSAPTGYKSKAAPMSLVSQNILKDTEYASDLQTDDKTVLGAINEVNSRTFIDDVVSGPIANFKTSLELPIKSLGIDVNAVQASGTPTPATPLPISGRSEINVVRCGKNLFNDTKWFTDNGYTLQSDGSWYKATNDLNVTIWENKSGYSGQTTVHWLYKYDSAVASPGLRYRVLYTDGTGETVWTSQVDTFTVKDFTSASGKIVDKIVSNYGTQTNGSTIKDFCISILGNTTYEPYAGTTEVINLGGTYYGGHLTQDKDGHRQFVVTHAILEKAVADMNNSDAYPGWRNSGAKNIVGAEVSSFFTGKLNVGNGYSINTRGSNDILYLPTGTYGMTQSQWIANYPDLIVQILLPYAEPIIIDLPDGEPINTLIGTNNIYADSGDASVEYTLTIKDYIDKGIASVQALILNS